MSALVRGRHPQTASRYAQTHSLAGPVLGNPALGLGGNVGEHSKAFVIIWVTSTRGPPGTIGEG
jgi:hypothetical protein